MPVHARRREEAERYVAEADRAFGRLDGVVDIVGMARWAGVLDTSLDDWEWGVDLFAEDPLVFKKLIYEMRFDEVSAICAFLWQKLQCVYR